MNETNGPGAVVPEERDCMDCGRFDACNGSIACACGPEGRLYIPSPQPECEVPEQEIKGDTDWILNEYFARIESRESDPLVLAAPPQESDKGRDAATWESMFRQVQTDRDQWSERAVAAEDKVTALERQLSEARDELQTARDALAARPASPDVSPDRSGEAGEAASLRADAIRSRVMRGEPITDAERCVLAWDTSSATDRASFERGWEARGVATADVVTVPRGDAVLAVEWYHAVQDLNPKYLEDRDRAAYERFRALRSSAQAGKDGE